MDLNLISIIAFYVIVAALIFRYRKNIIIQHKIFILFKTKVGIKLIDKIARFRKFWTYWGYAGIPIGFVGMVGIIILLISSLIKVLREPAAAGGVKLVLPWTIASSTSFAVLVPFWYFIIALTVLIVVHEGCHGIVARAHDIKLKSTGVGLLIALPLAFVEPDEKQMNKKPLSTRLSIFAAGPFANICTGIIFLFLSVLLVVPALGAVSESSEGIYITSVSGGMPAASAGIAEGDIISSINGVETPTIIELTEILKDVKPGDEITLRTQHGEIPITTTSNPDDKSRALIGINFKPFYTSNSALEIKYNFLSFIYGLFYWIFLLNIGVGLINLLPLGPVDGGQMIRASILDRFKNKKSALKLVSFISLFALLLLLLNIIGPIF